MPASGVRIVRSLCGAKQLPQVGKDSVKQRKFFAIAAAADG